MTTSTLSAAFEITGNRIELTNRKLGWYDPPPDFSTAMMNLHSEVSEAWEAWRSWGFADATSSVVDQGDGHALPKPEGVGSELADVFIRLLDTSRMFGVDLAAEVHRKMAFNRTREYRHGGKRA